MVHSRRGRRFKSCTRRREAGAGGGGGHESVVHYDLGPCVHCFVFFFSLVVVFFILFFVLYKTRLRIYYKRIITINMGQSKKTVVVVSRGGEKSRFSFFLFFFFVKLLHITIRSLSTRRSIVKMIPRAFQRSYRANGQLFLFVKIKCRAHLFLICQTTKTVFS